MASISKGGKTVSVALNPQKQTLDQLHKLIGQIAGRAGCDHCGRIAYLHIDFLGDPPPDLAQNGVISLIEGVSSH